MTPLAVPTFDAALLSKAIFALHPPHPGSRQANRKRKLNFPKGPIIVLAAYFTALTLQSNVVVPTLPLPPGPTRPKAEPPPAPVTQSNSEARST